MFISLIIVGFLHGFILLPLALYYLGLETTSDDEEKDDNVIQMKLGELKNKD